MSYLGNECIVGTDKEDTNFLLQCLLFFLSLRWIYRGRHTLLFYCATNGTTGELHHKLPHESNDHVVIKYYQYIHIDKRMSKTIRFKLYIKAVIRECLAV